ncbi:hypothetical protein R83H12_02624 [Fibrobacteria bacterium R8-3-H12]
MCICQKPEQRFFAHAMFINQAKISIIQKNNNIAAFLCAGFERLANFVCLGFGYCVACGVIWEIQKHNFFILLACECFFEDQICGKVCIDFFHNESPFFWAATWSCPFRYLLDVKKRKKNPKIVILPAIY